jgi:hypothetical protein
MTDIFSLPRRDERLPNAQLFVIISVSPFPRGQVALCPSFSMSFFSLESSRQHRNYPQTGFEEVGRIGTLKSACRK